MEKPETEHDPGFSSPVAGPKQALCLIVGTLFQGSNGPFQGDT